MSTLVSLFAKPILDSRGEWTLEVTATDNEGRSARASVPQGKSAGSHEAVVLAPVLAARNVVKRILPALRGRDVAAQREMDEKMCELDGTVEKRNLGGNATLAVSVAVARLAAAAAGTPLWKYFGTLMERDEHEVLFPRLLVNVINGGLHAGNNLPFQEYLLIPKATAPKESVAQAVHVYQTLRSTLIERAGPKAANLGDEGGFATDFDDPAEPFTVIAEVLASLGERADFGLDAAATNIARPAEELAAYYTKMAKTYPFVYLEDPFGEEDFKNFAKLRVALGEQTVVVGDDLTVTNAARMREAKEANAMNGIIIKPNQIGTLTEALEAVRLAKEWNWRVYASHRSGETNDDWIVDFAVGTQADGIKLGAPARGERIAKYNRLLEIEETALR